MKLRSCVSQTTEKEIFRIPGEGIHPPEIFARLQPWNPILSPGPSSSDGADHQFRASRYHPLDPDPAPATIASFGMHVGEFSTRRRDMFTLWGLVRTSNSCRGWGLGSWDLRKATLVPSHDELSYNDPNPGVFFLSTSMPIAIGEKDSRIELSLAPWLITPKPVFFAKKRDFQRWSLLVGSQV